jgi:hypothetical protein
MTEHEKSLNTPLVASTLGGAALCAECIAHRAGMAVPSVDEVLGNIHASAEVARCDDCLKQTVVHRLGVSEPRSPSTRGLDAASTWSSDVSDE